jgi:hypothetical protein
MPTTTTPSIARRAPALAPVLALLSGCGMYVRDTLYADMSSPALYPAAGENTKHLTLLQGEKVQLVTLSDGSEAIELKCAGPPWRIPDRTAEENLRRLDSAKEARNKCINEALRICRLHTWNGKSTFALLGDYELFGAIDGADSNYGRLMHVRCMTRDAYIDWAMSIDPSEFKPRTAKAMDELLRAEEAAAAARRE